MKKKHEAPRLIIELKSQAEVSLKDKAKSLTITKGTSLRNVVIEALEAYVKE